MASSPLRIASINTNGIRAAYRKGMAEWLAGRNIDILAIQEVRASTEDIQGLMGDEWHILHDPCHTKGRAGVAIASRMPALAHRTTLGGGDTEAPDYVDSSGRWLEADFEINGKTITVVSTYVHSGEVDTPKQEAKWLFLDAMTHRLPQMAHERELAVIVGDLNVGHRELDIKNWRGNVKRSGFLPRERAYFDRFFGPLGAEVVGADESVAPGLGWVDVGRQFAGEVDGPYTWWSWRGQAFDNDTGWRIDYQVATPSLADLVIGYEVDRAESYDTRWSDHAPVIVDYNI
ncbi:exodeoxyribonuclease III [Lysinibacter sp. HNR]|uniref:exodeoxyribonuclease III n=1 Tax=Lysinibacter sp. HNR TaxID=3031408 RepID=UPI002434AEC7|nr:exodeoxyribonuclease III [Lysinibacter sp. HNR]WGD37043.1 exodeoxyribonuclease III [Lysinibacter sp. HNR]